MCLQMCQGLVTIYELIGINPAEPQLCSQGAEGSKEGQKFSAREERMA